MAERITKSSPTHKKLEKLARHLGKLELSPRVTASPGEHKFNMHIFAETAVNADNNICGTTCCIAGEAVRVFDPVEFDRACKAIGTSEEVDFEEAAKEVLGITHKEADYLFYGSFSDEDLQDITPKEAASAVRALAREYK